MSYIVKLFQFMGLMEQTNCRTQKRQTTVENTTMKKTRKSNGNGNQLSQDGKGNICISSRIESVKSNLSCEQKMKM